jgi:hypothetical protein
MPGHTVGGLVIRHHMHHGQDEMNEQPDDERQDELGTGRVAPIFRLLGAGRLGPDGVQAVMAVLEAEGLPSVAASRIARASTIAMRPSPAPAASATARAVAPLRRLLASLILDRGAMAATAGVRGSALTGCRLLFAADGYEIVIQEAIDARRRGRSLLGQILQDGDPVAGAAVLLVGTGDKTETEADCEGSFGFSNVASGTYTLDVRAGDDQIACTPITLDAGRADGQLRARVAPTYRTRPGGQHGRTKRRRPVRCARRHTPGRIAATMRRYGPF